MKLTLFCSIFLSFNSFPQSIYHSLKSIENIKFFVHACAYFYSLLSFYYKLLSLSPMILYFLFLKIIYLTLKRKIYLDLSLACEKVVI